MIYDGLVHGTQPIESNLGLAMAEHVNAEIASGTIADSETAMDWLKHSFFYIRVTRNPRHYGFAPEKSRRCVRRDRRGVPPDNIRG